MNVILLCGGDGTRWKGDVPKHLVRVEGQVLLDRTLGQLNGTPATVVASDPRYERNGTRLHPPESKGADIDKVLCCRSLWGDDTLLLCGDVWFSAEAIGAITGEAPEDFRFYGRRHRSRITGGRWGEIFAFRFRGHMHEEVEGACWELRGQVEGGRLRRAKLWELYQVLIGEEPKPFEEQTFDHRWTQIDDWTEDFDTVEEHAEWLRRRSRS